MLLLSSQPPSRPFRMWRMAVSAESCHLNVNKNRGGLPFALHRNFSSRVPREVTDRAWMNSENSMRPSCGESKGGDGENKNHSEGQGRRGFYTLALFMMSLLRSAPSPQKNNGAKHLLQVRGYFCPAPGSLLRQRYVTSGHYEDGCYWLLAGKLQHTHTHQTTTVYSGAKDVSNDSTLCGVGMEDNSVRRGRKCPPATCLSSQLCWNFMHQISSRGLEITNYPSQKIVAFAVPLRDRTSRRQERGICPHG